MKLKMDQRYRVLLLGIRAGMPAITLILRYHARPPTSVNAAPTAAKTFIFRKLAILFTNISIKYSYVVSL